jgi:peptide/nickel transport system substrate-binding protein
MNRREFLRVGAAAASTLAAPRLATAAANRVLKFVPFADLPTLDPIWSPTKTTQRHGFMVFDTLFGMDGQYQMSSQMLEGAGSENDGKLWKLLRRPGLKWHDGERVLARDCVASIQRWSKRDSFGAMLMAATDEISAADDKTIVFRLKKPFPMLPNALGNTAGNLAAMMPERLAKTDPYTQITEMVGSGPYKFKPDERVSGSLYVYERFADYKPRESGTPDWTAGPKTVHFDRVEWHVVPDHTAAAGALQNGQIDWWENPDIDFVPLLKQNRLVKVVVLNPTGTIGTMRFNHLYPPFDDPAIRRALLLAVDQSDFMAAAVGTDPESSRTGVGFFCPDTPMASDAGMQALTSKRDPVRAKQQILAAGYSGGKVIALVPTDIPLLKALSDVGIDILRRCGLNVDYQAMDSGTMVQRRAKKDAPEKGGWNVFHTSWPGVDHLNPATNFFLRSDGAAGSMGWPSSPRIEALRAQWLDTSDLAAQKKMASEIQAQAFVDVPYIPLGQAFLPQALRGDLTGVLNGFAIFWNVRRTT